MLSKLAAAHRVMHHMAVRAHPHGAVFGVDVGRHGLDRHHAAPADAAGEARLVGAEQAFAHRRMNAVGADHDIGLDGGAVGEARRGVPRAAFDADAAGAEA